MGPGSFTGLRIGCGVAQGLAFGADLPLIPISTLRALAQSGARIFGAQTVLAVLDARLQEIYWGCYTIDAQGIMQAIQSDQLSKPSQVVMPALSTPCMGIGNGWQIYADALDNIGKQLIKIEFNNYPQAQDVAVLAEVEWQATRVIAPELALPVYLRNDVAMKSK